MDVNIKQIQKALDNTFKYSVDGTEQQYDAIRHVKDKAIMKVGSMLEKTEHYFTEKDWRKVHIEIALMLKLSSKRITQSGEVVTITGRTRNLGHGQQSEVVYQDDSTGWEHNIDFVG